MTRSQVVLGVDLGTSSAKAVAFDLEGTAIADAAVEVPLTTPPTPARSAGTFVEQDADVVCHAAEAAVAKTVAAVRAAGRKIAGIGLSGAMHAILAVDDAGTPLTASVPYADTRATAQAAAIAADAEGAKLPGRTGTPLHPMAPLAKLRWFAEEHPEIAEAAASWLSPKELLVRRWTGEQVVDHSIASATGLFDLRARAWDPVALDLAGVRREQLSAPISTTTVLRPLGAGVADRLGVAASTPLVVGAADGCLANLGAGAIDPGIAALTVGTSGAVRLIVDRPRTDPQGRLFCYALTDDRWVVGGAVNNGGLVLRWARDRLFTELAGAAGEGTAYALFDDLASDVPPGAEGLLFLPYLAGERAPLWDPSLRGVLFGLSVHHGQPQILRALLEGAALQLATVVSLVEDVAEPITTIRANGGFTASALWLRITAAACDRPLTVPRGVEGSSFGAALLAMQALGMADAFDLARRASVTDRTITVDAEAAATYRGCRALFTDLRDALLPHFHTAADLRGTQ